MLVLSATLPLSIHSSVKVENEHGKQIIPIAASLAQVGGKLAFMAAYTENPEEPFFKISTLLASGL